MAIKRYNVWHQETGADVTLDVDCDVLTPELATQINSFTIDADERLAAADDDVVAAVVAMAASWFLGYVLDTIESLNTYGMQRAFDALEGWPSDGAHGIRLVEWEGRPDLDSAGLVLSELEPE